MTVGELITALVESGNIDSNVYLVSIGDLHTVEDDLGKVVILHGSDGAALPTNARHD